MADPEFVRAAFSLQSAIVVTCLGSDPATLTASHRRPPLRIGQGALQCKRNGLCKSLLWMEGLRGGSKRGSELGILCAGSRVMS